VCGAQAKRRAKARAHLSAPGEKKFRLSVHPQLMHERSTGFPQLDPMWRAHYAFSDAFVIAVTRGT
jgi:hypothetical protein